MNKLGERNYMLIRSGVSAMGTYDPDEILYYFEEELHIDEIDEIETFLKWCHDRDRAFGSGNYEQVFNEFKADQK